MADFLKHGVSHIQLSPGSLMMPDFSSARFYTPEELGWQLDNGKEEETPQDDKKIITIPTDGTLLAYTENLNEIELGPMVKAGGMIRPEIELPFTFVNNASFDENQYYLLLGVFGDNIIEHQFILSNTNTTFNILRNDELLIEITDEAIYITNNSPQSVLAETTWYADILNDTKRLEQKNRFEVYEFENIL